MCAEGYGRGVSNTCHSCDDTTAQVLVAMGTLFSLVMLLLLILAVLFLVGGLDAIDIVRQSVGRNPSGARSKRPRSRRAVVPSADSPERNRRAATNDDYFCRTHARPLGAAVVGDDIEPSDVAGGHSTRSAEDFSCRHARVAPGACTREGGVLARRRAEVEAEASRRGGEGEGKPRCCGFGDKVKHWVSRLPLDKLKILVVVWQILAVFSSITGVEFPASYSRFLAWINVVNLDIGNILSASCVLPSANFYVRLLLTTLAPLVLVVLLSLTYRMAKHRAGIGSAGVIAKRAAWSRHVAAGLLLTFLVSFSKGFCSSLALAVLL